MIQIVEKKDIVIPFKKIGDPHWKENARKIFLNVFLSWGSEIDDCTFSIISDEEIDDIENTIQAKLPYSLREFYKNFLTEDLEKKLGAKDYIDRLTNLLPSCNCDTKEALEVLNNPILNHLVCFSNYLKTGKLFCFHEETEAVYLFDIEHSPILTKICNNLDEFLMGCLIYAQSDLFVDANNREEVEKWIWEVMAEEVNPIFADTWKYLTNMNL